jgi:hypothetical protein
MPETHGCDGMPTMGCERHRGLPVERGGGSQDMMVHLALGGFVAVPSDRCRCDYAGRMRFRSPPCTGFLREVPDSLFRR